MRCAYVNIASAQAPQLLHYRTGGSGPPLVMLHASPLSSKMLLPLAGALADQATILALDTPGYGLSDPLPEDPGGGGLGPYAEALEAFRQALGLDQIGVYGTATGAQIGVEYARRYPGRCRFLIVDNAAHFSESERSTLLDGYFPDLRVDDLGGHLLRTWSLARDQLLFFPWQDTAARLAAGSLNPAQLDIFAKQILAAGPNYAWAYREAFIAENVELLLAVTCPVSVMRWAGSIVKRYTDLFDDYRFPDNFSMQVCGETMGDRMAGLAQSLAGHLAHWDCPPTAISNPGEPLPRAYLGSTHLRSQGSGRPLLMLHPPGFNGETMAPLSAALAAQRQCLAPDLPGHGASPPASDFVAEVFELYEEISAMLGDRPELLAVGESAGLGVALAQGFDCQVQLLNPLAIDPDPRAVPDLAPKVSGSHWVEAWHWLRMRQMFAPWYEPKACNALHGELMLGGENLTQQLNAVLACADLAGISEQLSRLPPLDGSCGRWLTLTDDPMGDAALRAFPQAPWQPPVSMGQLSQQLENSSCL